MGKFDDLRKVIDLLDTEAFEGAYVYLSGSIVYVYADDDAHFAALTRALPSSIDHPLVKTSDDTFMMVTCTMGRIEIQLNLNRANSTCERVQVGTEIVEEPIMMQMGTKKVEKAVYEWKCPPVLAPAIAAEVTS